MGKALRIVGLIVMALAVVSCGGGVYIARLLTGASSESTTLMVTSALFSLPVFVIGAALFSLGTYRFRDAGWGGSPATRKKKVVCPDCAKRYPVKKLRCPSCGAQNHGR